MTPKELEDWLGTEVSEAVIWGDGESVAHESGPRIIAIESKKKDELDDDDHEHMRTVVGWGHDPLKDN